MLSSSEQEFLTRLTEITEANLENERFGVSELAREMGMSRSNLHRKLSSISKISVSQFICQVRLKHAMEMLRQTSLTVSEITYKVGFGSTSYFIKNFRDYYGYPPGKVGNRSATEDESRNSVSTKKQPVKIPFKYTVIPIFVIILSLLLFNLEKIKGIFSNKSVVNEMTVQIITTNNTIDSLRVINSDCFEFLIKDAVQRSGEKTLLNEEQFASIYSKTGNLNRVPSKAIKANIINGDFNYELNINIKDNSTGKTNTKKISFYNPAELLNSKIFELAGLLVDNPKRISPLTDDWDAFRCYIRSEQHWKNLNKYLAKRYCIESISIDSNFVLPKLKLAEIYKFEKNNYKALEQLNIVKKEITKLSHVDSIRTIALENALLGNNRESIKNYKELIEYMPATKQLFYELGEAYFNIGDIENAISNYKTALKFDNDFNLAINHLAYCYLYTGEHEKALPLFKKYVQLDSSANSFDSYGDGFYSAGKYDSARTCKLSGIKIEPNLDYLHKNLSYINVATGQIKEAEKNINDYLEFQSEPEMICTANAFKAYIYYSAGEYKMAMDTCLHAKSIYDSNELITRNHLLHWILAKSYFINGQKNNALAEMNEMKKIINKYKIDEHNYNEILKFYYDLKFSEYCQSKNQAGINEIINLFDLIGKKIKDWNSPFDPPFFNTEFGIELYKNGFTEQAKQRFEKALEFNPHFPKANYYLYRINFDNKNYKEAEKYKQEFLEVLKNSDSQYLKLFKLEQI